jgi:hypothetical protein
VPLLIPCHRVIRSDGSAGEYVFGSKTMCVVLEAEGVDLSSGAERQPARHMLCVQTALTALEAKIPRAKSRSGRPTGQLLLATAIRAHPYWMLAAIERGFKRAPTFSIQRLEAA